MSNGWELANLTIATRGAHTLKWGGRWRQAFLTDTSRLNFGGAFTFYSLDDYRNALAGQGGAAQFRLSAGQAVTRISQADAGIFAGDDWRVRPNVTASYGLRVEAQSNIGKRMAWAPRAGLAWGLDGGGRRQAKTLLRVGAGAFFDRVSAQVKLNSVRFDGRTQQSFLILNPGFYPEVPAAGALESARGTQQLQPVYAGIAAPRLYQTSLGLERQIGAASRVTVTWVWSRGVHLLNRRNVNAPVSGSYPFGDGSVRLLTESAGSSRQNQAIVNFSANRGGVFLFGFYALSRGEDDNEGIPADPYDLQAEWGPSSYGDLRHRVAFGATMKMPGGIGVAPFVVANTGQPYNITTGRDPGQTGFAGERPSLAPCAVGGICFDARPDPGVARIGRNFGQGPGAWNVALRLSRTWTIGTARAAAVQTAGEDGLPHGGPAAEGGKYAVTISASTLNLLNHANYANPVGNLSSPYFGQYRNLGGFVVLAHDGTPSTYNRKVDLQVRVTF